MIIKTDVKSKKNINKLNKPKIENPQEEDLNFKKYIIDKYSVILSNLEIKK